MNPTFLLPIHAPLLAAFWSTHYRGSDWRFVLGAEDVRTLLAEKRVLALGVFNPRMDGQLLATIVARPLTDEGVELCVGEKGRVEGAYIVEGLCVDPAWRGKHLAGWLISWVDYLLSRDRPRLFLWSREAPTALSTTNITNALYAYIRSRDLPVATDPHLRPVAWDTFRTLWANATPHWSCTTAVFPTALPSTQERLRVWLHELWGIVVVLSDTRRYTEGGETVWEVQWCGSVDGDNRMLPWDKKGDPRMAQMLTFLVGELVGSSKNEVILFVTDVPHQGGATTEWYQPWHVGRSGFHQTYMYNFMPPAFWSMTVMLPRWEL
jgi:GNAT superfamily N-acetyltransferase